MKCLKCNSAKIIKNGHRRGKQCYRCRHCGRQFVESPVNQSYPPEVKQLCLKMYLNGMGLRGIERVTEIHHTTIIHWIRDAGLNLPDTPEEDEIPEITEIDELYAERYPLGQTFGFAKPPAEGCRNAKRVCW